MTERTFRFILGTTLLTMLYYDLRLAIMALIGIVIFEGVTNWRIPSLISHLRFEAKNQPNSLSDTETACRARFAFDAERALRFVIAGILIVSYVLFNDQLWFIPWFVGFALTVAGLSGICPMVIALKRLGFR